MLSVEEIKEKTIINRLSKPMGFPDGFVGGHPTHQGRLIFFASVFESPNIDPELEIATIIRQLMYHDLGHILRKFAYQLDKADMENCHDFSVKRTLVDELFKKLSL